MQVVSKTFTLHNAHKANTSGHSNTGGSGERITILYPLNLMQEISSPQGLKVDEQYRWAFDEYPHLHSHLMGIAWFLRFIRHGAASSDVEQRDGEMRLTFSAHLVAAVVFRLLSETNSTKQISEQQGRATSVTTSVWETA